MVSGPPAYHALAESAGTKRSEEHTSELQPQSNLVCRLLLEKKKQRFRPLPHSEATFSLRSPSLSSSLPSSPHSCATSSSLRPPSSSACERFCPTRVARIRRL